MKNISMFEGFLFEREYWGTIGAGILPVCTTTGRVLVGLRSSGVMEPHTWSTFGGKLDIDEGVDEEIKEAALREMEEELRYSGHVELVDAHVYRDNGRFEYHNFFGIVTDEFKPRLNWEHSDAAWMTIDQLFNLPSQHYGLKALLLHSGELLRDIVGDTSYDGGQDNTPSTEEFKDEDEDLNW